MITYKEMGKEYLNEAEIIKNKLNNLQYQTKNSHMTRRQQMKNYKRINMLYDMYLECNITGKALIERTDRI